MEYAVYKGTFFQLPKALDPIGRPFRLEQRWNLCAISHKNDGWFVMKGVLKSKEEVNLGIQKTDLIRKTSRRSSCIGHRQQNT